VFVLTVDNPSIFKKLPIKQIRLSSQQPAEASAYGSTDADNPQLVSVNIWLCCQWL
jgi:hypothetical protein